MKIKWETIIRKMKEVGNNGWHVVTSCDHVDILVVLFVNVELGDILVMSRNNTSRLCTKGF